MAHDGLADAQSQAQVIRRFIGGVEGVGQSFNIFWRYAMAVVPDRHFYAAILTSSVNVDTFGCLAFVLPQRRRGIHKQVNKHLRQR